MITFAHLRTGVSNEEMRDQLAREYQGQSGQQLSDGTDFWVQEAVGKQFLIGVVGKYVVIVEPSRANNDRPLVAALDALRDS
jgi:hypothetical protein